MAEGEPCALSKDDSRSFMKPVEVGESECAWLAEKYHSNNQSVINAIKTLSSDQFIRLFVTAHGMKPIGTWQTHTYARFTDSSTLRDHFFLIPMQNNKTEEKPWIRFENGFLYIDDIQISIYPQSIPHTTPFWYFHYNPNNEERPYHSITLNLSPACLEKCVLCAGAKTGRVNNGMNNTLSAKKVFERIFEQYPDTVKQLDSVTIVTGCFSSFKELRQHLSDVREGVNAFCSPSTFRILEHNVTTEEEFDTIVRNLGYDIFITLECFDQNIRNIALNGKVGRKGRDSREFLTLIENYANYLESHPHLGKHLVRVTYLLGLDSLDVTDFFFQKIAEINHSLEHTTVIPWLSIFTAYNKGMKNIQNEDFTLSFILDGIHLSKQYFTPELLAYQSGGTGDGYARGLF